MSLRAWKSRTVTYRVSFPTTHQPSQVEMLRERIAVLPLANFSPGAQDDYLADGMTEELIAALSRVQGTRVIARTSVMRFRNTAKNILEIGRELRAGTILEGSVWKLGERIRVTVKLIDAKTEEQLWASNYDGDMTDIFSIQSDIAQKVADALRLKPFPRPSQERRPVDVQAYESYLQGRFFWNKRTPDGITEALKLFRQATEKDPTFAKAFSGMADCYIVGRDLGLFTPAEALAKAGDAVATALELDDGIAEAHSSVGIQLTAKRRLAEAASEFRKALAINPSYASAHHWYAINFAGSGDLDGALREATLAAQADPLAAPAKNILAVVYLWSREADKALEVYREILRIDQGFRPAKIGVALIQAYKGNEKEAMKAMEDAFSARDDYSKLSSRAFLLAWFGHREEALAVAKEAESLASSPEWSALTYSEVYACLGDSDGFFRWIGAARSSGMVSLGDMRYSFWLDRVRVDPRFAELTEKLDESAQAD